MWSVSSTVAAGLLRATGVGFSPQVILSTPTGVTEVQIFEDSSGVTASIGQQTGRTAELTTSREYLDAGLFNPLSDIVVIRAKIFNSVTIPLFMGRVMDVGESDSGHVRVRANDFTDDIISNEFITPFATNIGSSYATEITRLFHDSPYAVDVSQVPAGTVPSLTWELNRGQAIEDLAAGVNCTWQADREGGFIVYPNPFGVPVITPDVIFVDDSSNILVEVVRTTSRTSIYNAVTLVVERTDGTLPPTRITVYDNDPVSPTYYFGSFGKRNRVVKQQSPIDTVTAQALATRLLQQSLSLSETWQLTLPFYPLLDQGDIIAVNYRDVVTMLVVESVSYPLSAMKVTKVTGRKLQTLVPATVGVM